MTSASTYSETAASQATGPESAAHQMQAELNGLPRRQPPVLAEQGLLHGRPPRPSQVTVIVSQAAWQQIGVHGVSNLDSELGGALLGRAYRTQETVYVEVLAALPAVNRDHGPVHFTFTADSWAQFQQERAAHYPELDIIGWFHTHPGLGVFYSSDDVVVHSAAFTLPWHVGLVVDPIRREACFFGWVEGQLAPLAGFYELLDLQPESVVTWQVVRTAVYQDYDMAPAEPESSAPGVYLPASQRPALSSPGPGLGLIIGGFGLLLSLVLFLGWVLPLNRQVDRLQGVVLTLAEQALADSNAATCPDPRLRLLTPLTGMRFPVGSRVAVVGTAEHPDAVRYRVEVRPTGVETWEVLGERRWDTSLDQLVRWDTSERLPGLYEVRLIATDNNNVRLANSALCMITIELTP